MLFIWPEAQNHSIQKHWNKHARFSEEKQVWTKETQYIAFSHHYFLLCCYTSCPYISPHIFLLLSSVCPSLFLFCPQMLLLVYFDYCNPHIVSIMKRNNCVHPYFHIQKQNGIEPWGDGRGKTTVHLELSWTAKYL